METTTLFGEKIAQINNEVIVVTDSTGKKLYVNKADLAEAIRSVMPVVTSDKNGLKDKNDALREVYSTNDYDEYATLLIELGNTPKYFSADLFLRRGIGAPHLAPGTVATYRRDTYISGLLISTMSLKLITCSYNGKSYLAIYDTTTAVHSLLMKNLYGNYIGEVKAVRVKNKTTIYNAEIANSMADYTEETNLYLNGKRVSKV